MVNNCRVVEAWVGKTSGAFEMRSIHELNLKNK